MGKTRLNTRKHLHRAKRRQAEERKQVVVSTTFLYSHTAEMRKMLKGVDLGRFEAFAG